MQFDNRNNVLKGIIVRKIKNTTKWLKSHIWVTFTATSILTITFTALIYQNFQPNTETGEKEKVIFGAKSALPTTAAEKELSFDSGTSYVLITVCAYLIIMYVPWRKGKEIVGGAANKVMGWCSWKVVLGLIVLGVVTFIAHQNNWFSGAFASSQSHPSPPAAVDQPQVKRSGRIPVTLVSGKVVGPVDGVPINALFKFLSNGNIIRVCPRVGDCDDNRDGKINLDTNLPWPPGFMIELFETPVGEERNIEIYWQIKNGH